MLCYYNQSINIFKNECFSKDHEEINAMIINAILRSYHNDYVFYVNSFVRL